MAREILFSRAILYFPPAQRILQTGPVDSAIYALAWLDIPLLFGMDLIRKRPPARTFAGTVLGDRKSGRDENLAPKSPPRRGRRTPPHPEEQ